MPGKGGGGAGRAQRPAAAVPGRLPPEGVAAVVAGPGRARCSPRSRCCSSCCCPRTSSCPTSSAPSRRSTPRRSSPRPGSSSPPTQKEKVDPKAPAGSVIEPDAEGGREGREGRRRSRSLIAVGDGKITVPKIVGMNLADAEKALRDKKLTLGQVGAQPPDPEGTIESQIPAENEVVKEGAPSTSSSPIPNGKGKGKDAKKAGGGSRRRWRRRWRRRRRRRRTSSSRRSTAPRLDDYAAKLGRRRARPADQAGLRRLAHRHAVRDRAARRHQGRGRRQGDAARVGRLPASSRSTTTRTSCSSTAPTARSSTRSPRARSRRRTRPGAPTARRVAYTSDGAGCSSRTSTKPDATAPSR